MAKIKVNGISVNTETKYALPYQKTKKRFKGNNAKNTFDLESFEARSYGHWCYVRKIGKRVVFNDYNYSMTTNGHQATMRQLLKQLGIKVDLTVRISSSLGRDTFRTEVLRAEYKALFNLECRLANKRLKPATRESLVDDVKEIKRTIAMARKLGAECSKSSIARIKEDVQERYSEVAERKRKEAAEMRARNKLVTQQSNALLKTGEEFSLNA